MTLPPLPSRPAASVAAAVLVSAVAVTACSSAMPGGAAPGDPSMSVVAASSTSGGAVAGWPLPGQTSTTSFIPVLASAENVVGPSRFLLTLVGRDNRPIASPDRAVTLKMYDLGRDPKTPVQTVTADFVWAIEGERGFYVATVDFTAPGEWGVEVDVAQPGKPAEAARVRFDVRAKGSAVAVGQKAPSVETPTLADVGGDPRHLSTDTDPDPSLYTTSVQDALDRHEPFVLVFATPAFCQSRVCGPTLDLVKKVKAEEPDITFINVEPYALAWKDGSLQPVLDSDGQLSPVPAVDAYGLLVEPWIFVVDGDGIVRGSFEAVISEKELAKAIDAVR